MTSEYYPVFLFIYLKVILAQSFCRIQGLDLLFFINNDLFPFLARLIILSILLILSKKLVPISVNSWFNQNMKTNPKRTQTNPIFWRSNPVLSEKMGILDKFRTTFLCKTKPFFSKIQIENKGLTAVSACPAPKSLVLWQSSAAVYHAPTSRLFRSSRTYKVSAVAK